MALAKFRDSVSRDFIVLRVLVRHVVCPTMAAGTSENTV